VKALTSDELKMNEQAGTVAASAVGESVEAAARVEQCTQDMQLEAFGVGGINRGFVKGFKAMSKVMMPRTSGGLSQMETGGLPKSFVLAASSDKVYVIEDKQEGGKLVPGKVLNTFDRATFSARRAAHPVMSAISGVPEDRQVITIYLPLGKTKSKYMQAAARIQQAAGGPGQPHQMAFAKDDASNRLIDAITANAPAPGSNIMIGGQSLADMTSQAGGKPDPTEQLSKLADLHDRGVLSDDEFAAQKDKILSAT
jgi:hypothetical protein